jgi:DnaJ-like protein/PilZ domain-containing protein
MPNDATQRRDSRFVTSTTFDLTWKDQEVTRFTLARGLDISASGARIETLEEIPPGTAIYIQARRYNLMGHAHVRHCSRRGSSYVVGLEFTAETKRVITMPMGGHIDYYDVMQISPNADQETIHRVYRIMAARFHPDNVTTGNADRFLLLNKAYETLSDPIKRAAYDDVAAKHEPEALPIFDARDFVDDAKAEINRRLGVLCLLFLHRRNDPEKAGKSLLDLERLMGFPREYLAFTLWYLLEKRLVCRMENSDCAITAEGVDYLEANLPNNAVVQRLLAAPMSTIDPVMEKHDSDHARATASKLAIAS